MFFLFFGVIWQTTKKTGHISEMFIPDMIIWVCVWMDQRSITGLLVDFFLVENLPQKKLVFFWILNKQTKKPKLLFDSHWSSSSYWLSSTSMCMWSRDSGQCLFSPKKFFVVVVVVVYIVKTWLFCHKHWWLCCGYCDCCCYWIFFIFGFDSYQFLSIPPPPS